VDVTASPAAEAVAVHRGDRTQLTGRSGAGEREGKTNQRRRHRMGERAAHAGVVSMTAEARCAEYAQRPAVTWAAAHGALQPTLARGRQLFVLTRTPTSSSTRSSEAGDFEDLRQMAGLTRD
jgi:hypothetical protein